ncbi:N-acetylmuramoyl-L-alanine amidase [Clostridium sp. NSJ-6]|uniref:N-acetylmuramoyl-L-alanine amidase n=1 Tax=Clostridium hominis TaxID=2763036 RepID=A0ABR7DBT2_9CLOT|nr:N-acetylmuramoyl-L-alanine amidase [Clostridium hominis]MBC5628862.1 N-acetylmuramoyl-L-alanine amidase [Clostridium hominis]
MSLVKNLIPESQYSTKCPYSMQPKGICIHNTANDATAINERNYMARADNLNEVSFHIVIDDKEAIQCIPFNRNAWHAGDGGNGQGNRNYIAVEICYSKSGGDRFIKAEQRAAKEVATLLKQYGWIINNVKKHQDFSNKYCPHRTLDMGWKRFLNMIQSELNALNETSTQTPPANSVGGIKVGSKVRVIGANYATGEVVPGWVKNNTYTVQQVNGNKCLLGDIVSWVYAKDLQVVSVGNTAPSTPKPSKRYLNLKSHMQRWAIYNEKGPYTTPYKIGDLKPAMFGGLSYEILGNPATDVYIIQTKDYGKVAIWAPRDNDSSITNNPIY